MSDGKQKWVVGLYKPLKGGKQISERKYVLASSRESAIKTARFFSFQRLHFVAYARIATPQDLGCVPIPNRRTSA